MAVRSPLCCCAWCDMMLFMFVAHNTPADSMVAEGTGSEKNRQGPVAVDFAAWIWQKKEGRKKACAIHSVLVCQHQFCKPTKHAADLAGLDDLRCPVVLVPGQPGNVF